MMQRKAVSLPQFSLGKKSVFNLDYLGSPWGPHPCFQEKKSLGSPRGLKSGLPLEPKNSGYPWSLKIQDTPGETKIRATTGKQTKSGHPQWPKIRASHGGRKSGLPMGWGGQKFGLPLVPKNMRLPIMSLK